MRVLLLLLVLLVPIVGVAAPVDDLGSPLATLTGDGPQVASDGVLVEPLALVPEASTTDPCSTTATLSAQNFDQGDQGSTPLGDPLCMTDQRGENGVNGVASCSRADVLTDSNSASLYSSRTGLNGHLGDGTWTGIDTI